MFSQNVGNSAEMFADIIVSVLVAFNFSLVSWITSVDSYLLQKCRSLSLAPSPLNNVLCFFNLFFLDNYDAALKETIIEQYCSDLHENNIVRLTIH